MVKNGKVLVLVDIEMLEINLLKVLMDLIQVDDRVKCLNTKDMINSNNKNNRKEKLWKRPNKQDLAENKKPNLQ